MHDEIRVTTYLFEHAQAKPHFINSCCFGKDFAAWLLNELAPLRADRFELSGLIQEDYGWGIWCVRGKDTFWIALGYCGEGPTEQPPEWVISVHYDAGLNFVKRLFHKPDAQTFAQLRDQVWRALRSNRAIQIIS